MIRVACFALCTLLFSCGNTPSKETETTTNYKSVTTYYLIRHAEKDRTTTEDPGLTEVGKKRAKTWADYFNDKTLDAVYSTDYSRTRQTATPTATQKNLQLQIYHPNTMYDSVFQAETFGKSVLIVGHSNTTPAFVNAILGEDRYTDIDDTENALLYTVVISENESPQANVTKVPINQ